jgi:hypothetical protein
MEMPVPQKSFGALYLEKAFTYREYLKLVEDLAAEGKATGPDQSEGYVHYSQLNIQRMHRLEKTTILLPEIKEQLLSIDRPQTWLVITEGWCGDAAQSLPVIQAMSMVNPLITLRLVLRDEHPGLIDHYLTNGISRSIPILIAMDTATHEELFVWGPRPAALQQLFMGMKSEGLSYDVIKEEVQRWYNKDKTISIQHDLTALVLAVPERKD